MLRHVFLRAKGSGALLERKNVPPADTLPRRIQKARTSTQSPGVPVLAVLKAKAAKRALHVEDPKKARTSRGAPGNRPFTPRALGPLPREQPPGLGNDHPARLFLSSRPRRWFLPLKAPSAIRSRKEGPGPGGAAM